MHVSGRPLLRACEDAELQRHAVLDLRSGVCLHARAATIPARLRQGRAGRSVRLEDGDGRVPHRTVGHLRPRVVARRVRAHRASILVPLRVPVSCTCTYLRVELEQILVNLLQ